MNPFPTAWADTAIGRLKLHTARHPMPDQVPLEEATPGAFAIRQSRLFVRCADAWLELTEVQPEGKRRMSGIDLANGAGRGLVQR